MGKEYFGIAFCDQCGEEIERVDLWDVNGTHLGYPEDWWPEDVCDNEECQAALETEGRVLTESIVDQFLEDGGSVDLSKFTKLEGDDVAKDLGEYAEYLDLNGLTELSDAAAESLSKNQGENLDLDGLTELSDAASESLSKHRGGLGLRDLKELSDAAAESLSEMDSSNLYVNLDNLTASAAQILRDAGHGE